MTRKRTEPLLARKARFEKAKLAFETGIIEKVATAFYTSAALELMQTHRWKPDAAKAFLDKVTERTRDLLMLTYARREAVKYDELPKQNGEVINANAPRH